MLDSARDCGHRDFADWGSATTQDYWTAERVRLFDLAVRRSDFPAKALDALGSVLADCRTGIDVGAGVGSLTIPLARRLERVTALEPSATMRAALEANLRRAGVTNVRCVAGSWGAVPLAPHDLLLVANVSPIFEDLATFLDQVGRSARAVALMQNVGSGTEKFYLGELYPLLLGRPYPARQDYLRTVTLLHARGIYADVRIVEYDFDQPFASLEEAIGFWGRRMRLETPEQRERLTQFLLRRLRAEGSGWVAPMRRQSAVVSWRTDQASAASQARGES